MSAELSRFIEQTGKAMIRRLTTDLEKRKADIEAGRVIDLARYYFDADYRKKVGPLPEISYDVKRPSP